MITIYFTQCAAIKQDEHAEKASLMPMIPRVEFYEQLLSGDDGTFTTLDENMLLIAQWLKRQGKIKKLEFVSICNCKGGSDYYRTIKTDDQGDMIDDPHHGFFGQRLKYLR